MTFCFCWYSQVHSFLEALWWYVCKQRVWQTVPDSNSGLSFYFMGYLEIGHVEGDSAKVLGFFETKVGRPVSTLGLESQWMSAYVLSVSITVEKEKVPTCWLKYNDEGRRWWILWYTNWLKPPYIPCWEPSTKAGMVFYLDNLKWSCLKHLSWLKVFLIDHEKELVEPCHRTSSRLSTTITLILCALHPRLKT